MKKTTLLLSFSAILLAATFFSSCSSEKNMIVEKRHYGNGYYVHLGNHAEKKTSVVVSENKNSVSVKKESVVLSMQNSIASKKSPEQKFSSPANSLKQNSIAKPISVFEKKIFLPPVSPSQKKEPVKNKINNASKKAKEDTDLLVIVFMIILAIFIPPLAIFIKEGATKRFWIDLVIWLIAIGVFFASPFAFLLYLIASIWAVLIVAGVV